MLFFLNQSIVHALRSRHVSVDRVDFAFLRGIEQDRNLAAEPEQVVFEYSLGEYRGDSRVKSVSTLFQDRGACVRGEPVTASHHAMSSHDSRASEIARRSHVGRSQQQNCENQEKTESDHTLSSS